MGGPCSLCPQSYLFNFLPPPGFERRHPPLQAFCALSRPIKEWAADEPTVPSCAVPHQTPRPAPPTIFFHSVTYETRGRSAILDFIKQFVCHFFGYESHKEASPSSLHSSIFPLFRACPLHYSPSSARHQIGLKGVVFRFQLVSRFFFRHDGSVSSSCLLFPYLVLHISSFSARLPCSSWLFPGRHFQI